MDLLEHLSSFDTINIDEKFAEIVDKNFQKDFFPTVNNNRIGVLATQFYEMGGHTECVRSLVSNLSDKYEIEIFLTKKIYSCMFAPNKINLLAQHAEIDGFNCCDLPFVSAVNMMFNVIKRFAPKVLFVYIHIDDTYSVALLALLKKYTNIKIIFFPHATHYPELGLSFVDLVITASMTSYYIDKIFRKIDRHYLMPMFCDKVENIKYFSAEEIAEKRKELGIGKDNYFTMSGAAKYKFFDEEKPEKSPYVEMIRRLLIKEKNLKHLTVSDFTAKEMEIVNKIIPEPELRERLIFLPCTSDYQILFQSCDVFIDSFPVSSALTQIDLMKFKKPTVVKINNENILWSFHEYMPKDYPYMFENIEDMEKGILKLLYSKEEQQKVIEMNYEHYLKNFEGNFVKQRYINLIENCDNIEQFRMKANVDLKEYFKSKFNLSIPTAQKDEQKKTPLHASKILILGSSHSEIPLIAAAKNLGYYVITSGNQNDGLGCAYSDEYVDCDFSDKDAILKLAKEKSINAICSGCNDFALLTAAYVAEKLGLKGHDSYETSLTLHHKDKYRKFASENNIKTPKAIICENEEGLIKALEILKYPIIIKPVDLTGGKGIARCDNLNQALKAFQDAMKITREKHIIVEEFIEGSNHGFSAFIQDQKVTFSFADNEQYFINKYLVSGAYTPADIPQSAIKKLYEYCNKIAKSLSLVDGILHIQFILDKNQEPVIIEICRRAPGDLYVKFVEIATGTNYSEAIVCAEAGIKLPDLRQQNPAFPLVRHCIMGDVEGIIENVSMDKSLKDKIVDGMLWWKKSDVINDKNTYKAGILFIRFSDIDEMNELVPKLNDLIKIEAKKILLTKE